jgi:hypothetical protein
MPVDDRWERWAGRCCLAIAAALGLLGMHYGNVRFAPLVAGFAIFAGLGYAGRLRRLRWQPRPVRVAARPSLTSGHGPRFSSDSTHALGS